VFLASCFGAGERLLGRGLLSEPTLLIVSFNERTAASSCPPQQVARSQFHSAPSALEAPAAPLGLLLVLCQPTVTTRASAGVLFDLGSSG
jgi:hypothetical protein